MWSGQCAVAMLLALPAIVFTFSLPEQGSGPCSVHQRCVRISSCPAQQRLPAAQRRRSDICGFSGRQPRVCCDQTSEVSNGEPKSATHPALPTNCGKPSHVTLHPPYQKASFISGGHDADISKWPWMVLFGRWADGRLDNWFCGGTLITDRHVLTAAHCLRSEEAGDVGARIGDARLSSNVDVQDRNVSRITRHPRYRRGRHDLAVVRLAEPLRLSITTRPICLPPAGTEFVGQDVDVAGRGLLEFSGEPADRLQEAPLRITDPAACESSYRRVRQFESRFPDGFRGTVLCAGSRDGESRDACRGDSGGPLTIELPASVASTYQLVGVVSQGFGCGNPEFPGLYTKVSAYINWITRQLN